MLISVLVRSCNDETQIAGSLAAIFSQRTEDEVEVIVCDDGSTDGTRGILAGLGGRIRLLPRPPGPYFPGRTLNALVRAARGEIAVFNNADAVPLDERWLEGLVAPLKAGAADATFANQLPRGGGPAGGRGGAAHHEPGHGPRVRAAAPGGERRTGGRLRAAEPEQGRPRRGRRAAHRRGALRLAA